MELNNIKIVLPSEDPLGYALDWRDQIATAVLANGLKCLPTVLKSDAALHTWIQLRKSRKGKEIARFQRLNTWYTSAMRTILEPLLLTEADYETIAKILGAGIEQSDIKLYGDAYFAVRNAEGAIAYPSLLSVRFQAEWGQRDAADQGVIFQKAALIGGVEMLGQTLQATTRATAAFGKSMTLGAFVENEITRRVLQGQMNTRDLLRLQQNTYEKRRLEIEVAAQQGKDSEAWEFVNKILKAMAPKMVKPPSPNTPETRAALKAKIDSVRTFNPIQHVEPGGDAAMAEINMRIQTALKEKLADPMRDPPIKALQEFPNLM